MYLVGMKSYGRAPTFLAMTGYEQVRSVAAAIADDIESADRVELTLPETGVCGGSRPLRRPGRRTGRRRWMLRPRARTGADRHRRPRVDGRLLLNPHPHTSGGRHVPRPTRTTRPRP